MSELDLDIRAVASASYGARNAAPDVSQAPAPADTSSNQVVQAAQASQGSAAGQSTFRYDSFRFVYTPTYGKIVLIDQNPETGKAISQIPSQRALQIYAEQRRVELQTAIAPTSGSTAGQSKPTGVGAGVGVGSGVGSGVGRRDSGASTGVAASVVSPAPQTVTSVGPTPTDTPSPAFVLQSFAPVNITI